MGDNASSILGIGQSVLQAGLNYLGNQQQQNIANKMYDVQRRDALADWNRQNEYNSPKQQMQRYQEAGLNPNLIYGQSNVSQPIRSTSPQSVNIRPYEANVAQNIQSFQDAQNKKLQSDNMKEQNAILHKQNELLEQDKLIKAQNIMSMATKNERSKWDLGIAQQFDQSLKSSQLSVAQQVMRNMESQSSVLLQRNEREILQNNMNMRTGELNLKKTAQDIINSRIANSKSLQEISNLKQTLKNMENSNELQKIEIDLRHKGINPNDKMYERILGEFINKGMERLFPKSENGKFNIPKYLW